MFVTFRNEEGETKDFDIERKNRKQIIMEHDVKWQRVPKVKYMSRTARCAAACSLLQNVGDQLNDIASEIRETEELEELIKDGIIKQIENIELDISSFEELRDEIEEWKNNLEGTNLENTEKYKLIEECYETLDCAINELENIDLSTISIDDGNLENIADELESYANDIESIISDAENIEFPRMFS